jgi:plasmid maintenance system antidote protein VapI
MTLPFDTGRKRGNTEGMAKLETLANVLREAITRDGRSGHQLGRDAGVAPAVISRFLNRKRDLNLGTADRLCKAIGLELRTVKRPMARKGG